MTLPGPPPDRPATPLAATGEPEAELRRLLAIMAALRDPVAGCPWDQAQDFDSIAPYTIEEAYEVADAIARRDWEDLPDELGDLLFQVVYHARMAQEAGRFDFAAVARAIADKMLRRHPHVFGPARPATGAPAPGSWEAGKQAERERRALERAALPGPRTPAPGTPAPDTPAPGTPAPDTPAPGTPAPGTPAQGPAAPPEALAAGRRADAPAAAGRDLDLHLDPAGSAPAPVLAPTDLLTLAGVPVALPALTRAAKLTARAARVGFDWPDAATVLAKLDEEVAELRAELPAADPARLRDELGDMLFVLANLARKLGQDPETCLRHANDKFARRFNAVEHSLAFAGKTPGEATLGELEAGWQAVKAAERA